MEAEQLILKGVQPENALEQRIIRDPRWREGALWGEPRPGHPEGKVIYHIHEVLKNVDAACSDATMRRRLRLVTIIHDTFKHLEEKKRPRTDWKKHHAVLAQRFAQDYVQDKAVLTTIKLHDDAYYAWCATKLGYERQAKALLTRLIERLGDDLQLYYLFFKCDTKTGDKYQHPIIWLEQRLKDRITPVYWP
jgi:hypothetical protein